MADLIIRGMEMPKTCCQCDLKIYDPEIRWDENGTEQIGAFVCKRTREIIWNTQRGESCPLLPLPAGHGRLIDADKMRESIRRQAGILKVMGGEFAEIAETLEKGFLQEIDDSPTIDAVPVVRGKWIEHGRDRPPTCSNCGSGCLLNYESDYHKSDYCPHCGADMRQTGDENV